MINYILQYKSLHVSLILAMFFITHAPIGFQPDKNVGETGKKSIAQNIAVLIKPIQTDADYQSNQNSHYVVRNNQTHLNKLLLFMGGSYSSPKDYYFICNHAATLGLDVISLSYPNSVAAASLGTSTDALVFDKYRDELCFGNQIRDNVKIDFLNCITTRALKLILFLRTTYPDQNWGEYLTKDDKLKWDKIIVAGHSQGSGHACYIAKKISVNRVVMFSGPNDYSTRFKSAANWIKQSGQTPVKKYFSLLHTHDEIVPFAYQVENLRSLGLLTDMQSPVVADHLEPPYNNDNALSLNISALSNHNSTVGANRILTNIWTYMLTKE